MVRSGGLFNFSSGNVLITNYHSQVSLLHFVLYGSEVSINLVFVNNLLLSVAWCLLIIHL